MYTKYIAICTTILLSATIANAQMFTEIKKPSEELYKITEPTDKVIKNIKTNLKDLITLRLQSPEVGAGKEEISYFRSDIQNIYNDMDEQVHLFWKKNKRDIMNVYTESLTAEELIVYNKYLSSPESISIEKKRAGINKDINRLMQTWVEKHLNKHVKKLTDKIIQRQLNVNE